MAQVRRMTGKGLPVIFLVLLISFTGFAQSQQKTFEFRITGKQAGYVLLDSIVVLFAELSRTGTAGEADIVRALNNWMARARTAKKEGLIDEVFFKRYKRLLVVIRLTSVKYTNHAFDHLIIREINKFDIPQKYKDKAKIAGLASTADALVEEILSLKRYLDNKYKEQA